MIFSTSVLVLAFSRASRWNSMVERVPSICSSCFSKRFLRFNAAIATRKEAPTRRIKNRKQKGAVVCLFLPHHKYTKAGLCLGESSGYMRAIYIEHESMPVCRCVLTVWIMYLIDWSCMPCFYTVLTLTSFVLRSVTLGVDQLLLDFFLEKFRFLVEHVLSGAQLLDGVLRGDGFVGFFAGNTEGLADPSHDDTGTSLPKTSEVEKEVLIPFSKWFFGFPESNSFFNQDKVSYMRWEPLFLFESLGFLRIEKFFTGFCHFLG